MSKLMKLLMVITACAVLICTGLWNRVNTLQFKKATILRTQQYLLTIARAESHHMEGLINKVQNDLVKLVKDQLVIRYFVEEQPIEELSCYMPCRIIFRHFSDIVHSMYRINTKGIVCCRLPLAKEYTGKDYSKKQGIKFVLENHTPYISKVFTTDLNEQAFSVCQPVFYNKEFKGMVRALIHLDAIKNCITHIKAGKEGYPWIINNSGTIIFHTNPEYVGNNIITFRKKIYPDSDLSELQSIVEKMRNGEEGTGTYQSVRWKNNKSENIQRLTAFAPIRLGNELWSIGVSMSYEEIAGPIEKNARDNFTVALLLVLLGSAGITGFYKTYKKKIELDLLAKTAEKLKISNKNLEREITERKKIEEQLREIVKAKAKFTSMVSHELRTPFTAIKEGLNIVYEGSVGKLNEEQKNFLNIAKRNLDRLHRLINNVLDFAKLESGKIEFNIRHSDINQIISNAVLMQNFAAKEKKLYLKTNLADDLPEIKCDEDRIMQVLTNLINNAIKFTKTGGITISSQKNEKEENIRVSVKDTGIGIKKNDFAKLFSEFQQVGDNTYRRPGGTGLGLAICREILTRHNGKIWVKSTENAGSEFIFTLPIFTK